MGMQQDNAPPSLPRSWVLVSLGEVVDYRAAEKTEPKDIPADAWVLELEDVEKDTSWLLQRLTQGQRNSKSTKNRFRRGDVLYGKLRPYLNKVLVASDDGYCTTEIIPIRETSAISSGYLFYALKRPDFLRYVGRVTHGINMPRLGPEAGEAAPLPLPPINEQRRIVAKLDALFERSRNIRDKLDQIPALLDQLRKSILASAFRGDLTREWREKRSRKERWEFVTIGDIAEVGTGSTPLRSRSDYFSKDGMPWVTSAATGSPYVTQVVERVTRQAIIDHRLKSYPVGTLLVAMYGEGKTRGQVTELCIEATLNQACAAIHVDDRQVERQFVKLALQANYYEMRAMAEGGNQPNLNLSKVRSVKIPLPRKDEQQELVKLASAALDKVNAIAQVVSTLADRRALTESALLAKAFRGELVPQDPNDEPASVLLERIRAERTAQVGQPKRRRKAG